MNSKTLPINVHCPRCRHCIRLDARNYLVSDHGLIVPPRLSLHCPSCHSPVATNTLLPYWQLDRFIHRPPLRSVGHLSPKKEVIA